MESKLNILMVGRIYEEQAVFKIIEQAIDIISQRISAIYYFTDSRTKDKILDKHQEFTCLEFVADSHQFLIDFIITIGGDGTILYAAKQFKDKIPPVVTFQRGSLGFMCRFSLEELQTVINKTIRYYRKQIELPFEESCRMRLKAMKKNSKQQKESLHVCVNEVYISRKGHERITLQIIVNGQVLTKTSGDGLLISTPTGSTAYSLSAGGPILQNGVNGILIVPISPNSLSFRPICLPSDASIQVKVIVFSCRQNDNYDSYTVAQEVKPMRVSMDSLYKIFKNKMNQLQKSPNMTSHVSILQVVFEPRKQEAQLPSWIQRLKYFLGWNQKYKAPIHQYEPEKLNKIQTCNQAD